MKRLVIVRHAKAEHGYDVKSDSQRSLTERGQNDSLIMAEQLKQRNILPELMLASPAVRALQTAYIFAGKMNYMTHKIIKKDSLYHDNFHTKDFIKTIHKLDDKYNTVFVFGHNPYFSDVAARFTSNQYEHIPTAGVKSILFNVDSWAKVALGQGKLELFDCPEKYREQ